MTSSSLAIQWNNQGAQFLINNEVRAARLCFSQALLYCREAFGREISIANGGGAQDQQQEPQEPSISYSLNALMADRLHVSSIWGDSSDYRDTSCCLSMASRNEPSFVYNQPIQLPDPSPVESTHDDEMQAIVSSAVLFNTAMAHHLMAEHLDLAGKHVVSQSDRDSLLEKAIRLYHLSYDLLGLASEQPVLDCEVLQLAIVNNLAMAHQGRGDGKMVECCIQHLLSSLRLCIYYGILEDHHGLLDCFLATSACLEKAAPLPAAAA
jgi:hypothetical protein